VEVEEDDFDLSQTRQEEKQPTQREEMELRDVEMLDYEESLEKEKEEMKRMDSIFEKKAEMFAHVIQLHNKDEGTFNENEKGPERLASKKAREMEVWGWKTKAARRAKFVIAEKSSIRVIDKEIKILDKGQALMTRSF
jgi:hypothetical protein